MAGDEEKSNSRMSAGGTLLGGIGGFLSGAAAVAALLMARPDVITVVVPVTTLERVVEQAKANSDARSASPEPTVVAEGASAAPPLQSPAPTMPAVASQSLQEGLSASLLTLASTPAGYVANVRITNESGVPVLVAARARAYGGDFAVSDATGGACPWRANGESLGTLTPATGDRPINPNNYTPVAPGQSTTVTLIFHRGRCDVEPSGGGPANLSGTFVIVQNDVVRFASVSFESVTPVQP